MSGSNADIRQAAAILRAAEAIRGGRLVVFPTETVYGLGASAFDATAVSRIFEVKGRPADNPLIVHLADISGLAAVTENPPEVAFLLFERFSPGPLTLVLSRSSRVPAVVSAGLQTVAVRIPSHPVARELIRVAGVPIAAPSANRSGRPSPTDVEAARGDLGDRVAVYLDGGPCEIGLESTVVRVPGAAGAGSPAGAVVEVLREGAVTREMLAGALRVPIGGAGSRSGETGGSSAAESPGTRHAHYMPRAIVIPFEEAGSEAPTEPITGTGPVALLCFGETPDLPNVEPVLLYRFDSLEEYAKILYRAFREADEKGCDRIYAELPPARGIGRALRDRILRASGFANS